MASIEVKDWLVVNVMLHLLLIWSLGYKVPRTANLVSGCAKILQFQEIQMNATSFILQQNA